MKKILFLVLFSILSSVDSRSDSQTKFRYLTVEDGLASNRINNIVQDSYGFIWIATREGLNRFDSHSFKLYKPSSGYNYSGNDNVYVIMENEENDELWFGTFGGAYVYNYLTDSITSCGITEIQNSMIRDIARDKDGYIWLSVRGFGVSRYNTKTKEVKHFRSVESDESTLVSSEVMSIVCDPDGNVWFLTDKGIDKYNIKTERLEHFTPDAHFIDKHFRDGCIGPDGNLWVLGWKEGLCRIDIKSHEVSRYQITGDGGGLVTNFHTITNDGNGKFLIGSDGGLTTFDIQSPRSTTISKSMKGGEGLNDRFVYSIIRDSEGGLWIGTYFGGVNYMSPYSELFDLYSQNAAALSVQGCVISRFCEDRSGNIWIGTDDAGLHKFDPKTNRSERIIVSPSQEPINIHALYSDKDYIWVGTYQNGLFRYQISNGSVVEYPEIDDVYSIIKDSDGNLWAGTLECLYCLNPTSGRTKKISFSSRSYVEEMVEYNNVVWIVSTSKGLSSYNIRSDELRHYDRELTEIGVSPANVRTLDVGDGKLWIGVSNYGVLCYDFETGTFTEERLMGSELSDKNVRHIIYENRNLWITTSNGFYLYNTVDKKSSLFNSDDGLQGNQFNPGTGLLTLSGEIYIGGSKGFNRFDPSKISIDNRFPSIVFSRFQIFNEDAKVGEGYPLESSINISRRVTLNHTQTVFSIEFSSLNYSSSSKTRYKYRLVGFESDYTEVDSKTRSVTYTNIPNGEYRFEVYVMNNSGEWNEEPAVAHIVILPPWWNTVTARMVFVLLVVALITLVLVVIIGRANRKNRAKIRKLKVENEQRILKTKIDFFTHIAHEIRTPAALISAPIEEIIKSGAEFTDDVSENLEIIQLNSSRLVNLVNQVMDFHRTEGPDFEIYNLETNVDSLLRNIALRFSAESKSRSINVVSKGISKQEPLIAYIDAESLTKIVSNLMANAMKFTRDVIELELKREDEGCFLIIVRDNGIGIESKDLGEIFKPFYTTAAINNRPLRGFGIGLSLVAILSDKMGIEIDVETQPGLGTAFILRCKTNGNMLDPVVVDDQSVENTTSDSLEASTISQMADGDSTEKILLVEDNEDFSYFLNKVIKRKFTTVIADNGKVALDVLEREKISLVISDVAMPVMDGFALCEYIKTNSKLNHIPIILLTAQTDPQSKIKGLQSGADVYLEKPVSMEYLYAQMVSLLDKRRMLRLNKDSYQVGESKGGDDDSGVDNKFIVRLNAIIEENLSDVNFSVDILSRHMGISRSALYAKLKIVSNLTPNEFIRNIRLRRAAEYLSNREYRISEVCYLVGFNNPSYFSRCFFDYYGVLPKDFIELRMQGRMPEPKE